jgi:uncharacterized protein YqgC (DUF456 family)
MGMTLLWILAIFLVVVGFAGTVLPALPGIPLMLLGMVIAAWIDDFTRIGVLALVILGVLTVLSIVIDFAAAAMGAKRVGASRQAIIGAALGAALGFFFGLPGLILGPFAGAVAGELMARRRLAREDIHAATKVGVGAWIGFAAGSVARLAVAFTMLGVFATAWFVA